MRAHPAVVGDVDQIIQAHAALNHRVGQRRTEEFAAIQQRANQVIRDLARSERFDLILQDVVYVSPRFDITERVLKALDD